MEHHPSMSGEKKRQIALFIAAIYMFIHHPCHSVSLGKFDEDSGYEATAPKWIPLEPQKYNLLADSKTTSGQTYKSGKVQLKNDRLQLSYLEEEALSRYFEDNGLTLKSVSWNTGNVSKHQHTPGYKSKTYQSDQNGFRRVPGEISDLSDNTHLSDWLAMTPSLQCDQNVMTFTASGGGFTNLFVGSDEGVSISLFDLPSLCGFTVKTSWGGLELTVPYDSSCYITQEDGKVVLPLEWWGSPMKLSCPIWRPLPAPTVYCSPYGMVLHIVGQKEDLPTLGFKVEGRWGPLLTDECASLVTAHPGEILLFILTSALCITVEHGVHLWLVMDELEYTVSCPEFPHVPLLYPLEPAFPGPVTPAPPSFPPLQTLNPIYLNAKLPHIHAPQPPQSTKPSAAGPPGPQPLLDHIFAQFIPSPPVDMPHSKEPKNVENNIFISPPRFPDPKDFLINHYAKPTVPQNTGLFLNANKFQILHHPAKHATQAPHVPPKILGSPIHSHFFPPSQTDDSDNPYLFHHPISVNRLIQPPSVAPSYLPQSVHEPYIKHCSPYEGMVCSYYRNPYYPHHPHHPPPIYPPVSPTQPPSQEVQHYCLGDQILVRLPFAHQDSIQVKDPENLWQLISKVSPFCWYNLHSFGDGVILYTPLPGCHTHKPDSSISLSLRFWDLSLGRIRTVEVPCPLTTPAPPPYTPLPYTPPPYTPPPYTPPPYRPPPYTPPPYTPPPYTPPPYRPPPYTPRPYTPPPPFTHKPEVHCSLHHMTVIFPSGTSLELFVKDFSGNNINLRDVSKDCGHSVSLGKEGKVHLLLPLHLRCHVTLQGSLYFITVVYTTFHVTKEAQLSCSRSDVPTTHHECNLPPEHRLPCGLGSVSQPQCVSMGCCFGKHHPACYYPMDECTADRHFVFSVPAFLTEPPLSLTSLVAGGNPSCTPQKVTSDERALFKVPMDACGARRMQVGKTLIYILEVNNIVKSVSLNYGTITRDSPVRLLVECRFLPGSALTVSYMVKTPTLGPGIQTPGVFGVQIRIAKDSQYKSYYPQYHQPLQMLLGKPLYLEVRLLNSPDPSLVLLVHYCVAYPRSGKAIWVLLYNGCPNPLDPQPNKIISNPEVPARAQTRHFTISTFQFLPDGEFKDSNEEIYFMCSTEICSPRDGPCVEGCFGQ